MAKVLVADDDPLTLRAVKLSLELAGHEVVATTDAATVSELAVTAGVDAAVLDVVMPAMSGYDVLHALRHHPTTAHIPVIFLSGLGQGPDRVRGLREGADDYLVKPFEPAELVLRLDRMIAHARAARTATASPPRDDDGAAALARLEEHVRDGRLLKTVSLGRYQVLAVLGEGARGTVFRGWDTKLLRPVALKTIRFVSPGLDSRPAGPKAGLLQEAITAAQFHHSNIVAIFDLQETPDTAFIIMEFVNGMNLGSYLAAGGPPGAESVLALGTAIAAALAAAHSRRVVHHDLKPANVLLGRDGSIKVSDFGIAAFLSSVLRAADTTFGTPGYVPPECLTGETFDERGDLFALGVTLYACLAGKPPFAGATLDETIRNTIELEPPSPRSIDPACPVELSDLVMTLLAKQRSQRRVNAAHVATQLALMVNRTGATWNPSAAVMEAANRALSPRGEAKVVPRITASRGSQ